MPGPVEPRPALAECPPRTMAHAIGDALVAISALEDCVARLTSQLVGCESGAQSTGEVTSARPGCIGRVHDIADMIVNASDRMNRMLVRIEQEIGT
jgi:hypothetical protein